MGHVLKGMDTVGQYTTRSSLAKEYCYRMGMLEAPLASRADRHERIRTGPDASGQTHHMGAVRPGSRAACAAGIGNVLLRHAGAAALGAGGLAIGQGRWTAGGDGVGCDPASGFFASD